MYTVEQMRAPSFARSWYEAVAVVQEVASALGSLSTVPAAEDLLLEEDGTVSLGFASEAPEDAVAGLATLLLQLLEGTSPPAELGRLAGDYAGLPAGDVSIARFSEALAIYERPDRRVVIRGVVGRLAARRIAEETDRATQRLRERLTGAPRVSEDVRASFLPAPAATSQLRRRVPALIETLRQRATTIPRHQAVAGGTMLCAVLAIVGGLSFVLSQRSAAAPLPAAVAPEPSAIAPGPSKPAGSATGDSRNRGERPRNPPASSRGRHTAEAR